MLARLLHVLCVVLGFLAPAAAQTVVYPRADQPTDRRDDYPLALLTLALKHVDKPYRLQRSPTFMLQGRAAIELQEGHTVDVIWTMTTAERERTLRAVRVPIDRGLLGWRLLLVRKQDLRKFADLAVPEQLARLRGAQGFDWPDTTILQRAGFNVEAVSSYDNIFTLLSRGRVDYFPRSVQEIWDELANHRDMDLAVEPTIALHYPAAMYFFVNRNNETLAKDIETGLLKALDDGSFDALFQKHFGTVLRRARLETRRVVELNNPLLPQDAPLRDARLWYRPQK